jgi:retron-type reverse transcriptase
VGFYLLQGNGSTHVTDIRGFFDNLSPEWTMKFIEHRVADRRILRLIRKWLKAGVSESECCGLGLRRL